MPENLPRVPTTYAALRQAVEVAMIKGQQEIERSRVRTYWETGRLIHEHLLHHKERAYYGTATIQRLADDLSVDRSVLQRCMQFVRAFPNCAAWHKLTWGHYRALIPIADARQRRALATTADRQAWSIAQLEQHLRTLLPLPPASSEAALAAPTPAAPPLLTPRRGTPGIRHVIATADGPAVDLGFACYLDLPPDTAFAPGALVQLDSAGRPRPAPDATKSDLFTYAATVLKLVDADTLWVKIRLGQRHWLKQKLRLRDLDCPELATPEGKAAKRYVEAQLATAQSVTICTTRPDKYDRYLADVYLSQQGQEIHLNNELLSRGYAVIKRQWEFGDWGDK